MKSLLRNNFIFSISLYKDIFKTLLIKFELRREFENSNWTRTVKNKKWYSLYKEYH